MTDPARRVLLVTHTGREDAVTLARLVAQFLLDAGIEVRGRDLEAADLSSDAVRAVDAALAARAASSSSCSAATARSCAAPSSRGRTTSRCSGSTSATSGSSPRSSPTR